MPIEYTPQNEWWTNPIDQQLKQDAYLRLHTIASTIISKLAAAGMQQMTREPTYERLNPYFAARGRGELPSVVVISYADRPFSVVDELHPLESMLIISCLTQEERGLIAQCLSGRYWMASKAMTDAGLLHAEEPDKHLRQLDERLQEIYVQIRTKAEKGPMEMPRP